MGVIRESMTRQERVRVWKCITFMALDLVAVAVVIFLYNCRPPFHLMAAVAVVVSLVLVVMALSRLYQLFDVLEGETRTEIQCPGGEDGGDTERVAEQDERSHPGGMGPSGQV